MKKNRVVVFIISLVLFILSVTSIRFVLLQNEEDNFEVESIDKKRFEILKASLEKSGYFIGSDIEYDDVKRVASIDKDYDIHIKSGTYMMTIKDFNRENKYCEIVDAIEQGLGVQPGKAIDTCKETLNGSLNLGGISAEIYDNYKVLSVQSEEKAQLYDAANSHMENELISVDEINYNINIDDYLITSISTNFASSIKQYSLCGNIFNKNKKENDFFISIYDENKELLNGMVYQYRNETDKYISFCVEYNVERDNIKYYSINRN